ncbi:hypothetical protein VTN02DRAFT_6395 [Thermoascus thermophilus]
MAERRPLSKGSRTQGAEDVTTTYYGRAYSQHDDGEATEAQVSRSLLSWQGLATGSCVGGSRWISGAGGGTAEDGREGLIRCSTPTVSGCRRVEEADESVL